MKEETPTTTYEPTAEGWTSYRLDCWMRDNMIGQEYRQPEPVVEDYFEAAFQALWESLGENKE